MTVLDTRAGSYIAILLLAAGLIIAALILLRPGAKVVPMSRRRPTQAAGQGTISSTVTTIYEKQLGGSNGKYAGMLDLAGIRRAPEEVLMLVALAGLVAGALVTLLLNPIVGIVAGLVVVVGFYLFLTIKISKTRKKFANLLDETLQAMAGSLRAGYSLLQAVSAISGEAESPMREEFTRVVNQTRVGRPVNEALEETAARMESEDFYWVSQAIAINREVGGNLADVLDGVASTIRERSQLKRQVAALSAEGKTSAYILLGLPFVILAALMVINPGYAAQFFTPVGYLMLGVSAVLLTLGAVWLFNIIKLKY